MSDGISDMIGMREKAKRKAPAVSVGQRAGSPSRKVLPPRNPAKPVVETKAPTVQVEPDPQTQPVSQVESKAVASAEALVEDRRVTLYIAAEADEWLEGARLTGRRAGVDASRSAIVRMALERLMSQMSHEQVVAELGTKADAAGPTRGRRRL